MNSQLDLAMSELFPAQGQSRVGNVKFFDGYSREVTREQLAEQLRSANEQIVSGRIARATDIDGDLGTSV